MHRVKCIYECTGCFLALRRHLRRLASEVRQRRGPTSEETLGARAALGFRMMGSLRGDAGGDGYGDGDGDGCGNGGHGQQHLLNRQPSSLLSRQQSSLSRQPSSLSQAHNQAHDQAHDQAQGGNGQAQGLQSPQGGLQSPQGGLDERLTTITQEVQQGRQEVSQHMRADTQIAMSRSVPLQPSCHSCC